MLGVGCVGAAPECKQPASLEEALGHRAASFSEATRLSRKKLLDELVPREQALFYLSGQLT